MARPLKIIAELLVVAILAAVPVGGAQAATVFAKASAKG